MKERFTSVLSASLKDIAADQRIILDTGDGAAVTFLGDPEDALFVAMQLRDALKTAGGDAPSDPASDESEGPVDVPIRTGINLGPVKLVRDINGQPNIVGDGINVAQRIMSFAPTRQIVVSRSFYDMVSVISDEYSKLFTYEGSRTDKHVRDHEIYVVGESAAAFKQAKDGMTDRAAITNSRAKALKIDNAALARSSETSGALSASQASVARDRKKFFLVGGVLAIVVVLLSLALILKTGGGKPTPGMATNSAAKSTESTESAAPVPAPDASAKASAPVATAETKAEVKPAAPPVELPGVLTFGIQPWGEIFINGKSVGVSPPMKQTKLAPGQYSIEVRNTSFPPFTTRIDLKPKETRNIAHKF